MFSKIWGVLGIARHAVALVILTGATTGLVAGSLDVNSTSHATATSAANTTSVSASKSTTTNGAELDVLVRLCLETKDPQSGECARALDKSGMAADEFWAKVAMSLHDQVRKQDQKKDETPKPEDQKVNTSELLGLVNACVESHERSSEPCAKALSISGLSADEFWAKVSGMFNKTNETPKTDKPSTAPKTDAPKTDKTSEEIYALIKDCLAKFDAAKTGTYSEPISTSEACRKAFEATGLTPEQFYARFVQKATTPKPTESPKTAPVTSEALYALIKDCLAKYEAARTTNDGGTAASDACKKAIEASGMTSGDFWAKFGPKPTTTSKPQPTPTAKPQTTQTVSDADLIVMVRDCFTKYLAATATKGNEDLGRAASEACTKAIVASGLVSSEFWVKFGTPQSPKI